MIIFVIICAIIVVWCCISAESAEKERISKQTTQQKAQNELAAKVKEAEALVPQVASSAFYKEVASFVQSELTKKEQSIRYWTSKAYFDYLRSNSGVASHFVPEYQKYAYGNLLSCSIYVSYQEIYGFDYDFSEREGTKIWFSSHGYADLTRIQLYALLKTLCHNFNSLHIPLTVDQVQSKVLNEHWGEYEKGVPLRITDDYIKSIVDSEIRYLQNQKSPYKNAF